MSPPGNELERLIGIMARLRAEGGCPWDREQDLRSLRPYLVEETFEVLDEMDRVGYGGAWRPFCEELGDLLFQIVFHAQLAAELGEFTMADVCRAISDKIESRHPHVFGERAGAQPGLGAEQVLDNWAKLKAAEKKRKTGSEGSVLDGVPTAAPALLRAERLTEKASRIGFDWPDTAGVRAKLDEELRELDEAIASGDRDALEHELGDVLFSVANLARFIRTPAEDALRMAIRRFTTRFHHVEAGLRADGAGFGEATLEQMERHWQAAKAVEKALPPVRSRGRADLALLRLPVPALAPQRAFWDTLAPLLGWTPAPGAPGEARYGDGALTLAFLERAGVQPGGEEMELRAPSAGAVQALRAALREQLPGSLREGEPEGDSLGFVDPAGLSWRYVA
jgi:nucleoside triphosphate diphosphatase